ncbi:7291_t:CDS:1 [Ambispora gerdemannii]|uniref:7291_t:CDS:1 n=1 Tax=Ambispora gerdemannii TaxID=144530 RepID=A0A9N9D2N3_9GLOM|nr:7291_t:CDS:1 [Ambispora gerdemannii]
MITSNIDPGFSAELDRDYELMRSLGLLDNEPESNHNENVSDNDDESDDDECDYEGDNNLIDGWNYLARYGEEAWKNLLKVWMAHQRNIVLMEFTRRLPNISGKVRNGLFDAFSRSSALVVKVHNLFLDTLAHPTKGWNPYPLSSFVISG